MNSPAGSNPTIEDIDQCLPQTQCTKCGFPSCLDYATALHDRETQINRCPPGGEVTLSALAACLGGLETSLADDCDHYGGRLIARIIELECIGCTLCIDPCPVDAIVGTSKQMHTILVDDCTGCELCISVCPVDCIKMVPPSQVNEGETWPEFSDVEVARWRVLSKKHRARQLKNLSRTTIAEREEIQQQIRSAVNRERTKRWKGSKRAARISHLQQSG